MCFTFHCRNPFITDCFSSMHLPWASGPKWLLVASKLLITVLFVFLISFCLYRDKIVYTHEMKRTLATEKLRFWISLMVKASFLFTYEEQEIKHDVSNTNNWLCWYKKNLLSWGKKGRRRGGERQTDRQRRIDKEKEEEREKKIDIILMLCVYMQSGQYIFIIYSKSYILWVCFLLFKAVFDIFYKRRIWTLISVKFLLEKKSLSFLRGTNIKRISVPGSLYLLPISLWCSAAGRCRIYFHTFLYV